MKDLLNFSRRARIEATMFSSGQVYVISDLRA